MATPGSKEDAQAMYDMYFAAEQAVLKGQSYTIGGRSLTRSDLTKIQEGRKYWADQLSLIDSTGSNKPRVTRVILR